MWGVSFDAGVIFFLVFGYAVCYIQVMRRWLWFIAINGPAFSIFKKLVTPSKSP